VDDHTLDIESADLKDSGREAREPSLVVALECDRPLAPSSRHRLGRAGKVILGRGAARDASRSGDYRHPRLRIAVADRRMSSTHAEVEGMDGVWNLTDPGSRNGVLVNGVRVQSARLRPGDVIQLGHTLLLYEESAPFPGDDDVDSGTTESPLSGLATLNADLASSFAKLAKLARADLTIMLLGETGTGKEVTARSIHELSAVSGQFVGVNCAALPATLVEGELFGSLRGAYSGSVADRAGLIRQAHRGTLFLDEIGDLPLPAQAALLRVLQERAVRPLGGERTHAVDIRLVSATNQDAEALVRAGTFRGDLFARTAGFRIALPPLRSRRHDIGLLVSNILKRRFDAAAESVRLSMDAGYRLLSYDFPLNVRELENWLTAAVALAGEEPILPEHFPDPVTIGTPATPAPGTETGHAAGARPLTAAQIEHRSEVLDLLRRHGGNVSAAAREFGKARNQVQRWIQRYGIDLGEFR
jgi:DNA-binding NtrC family response regulator